MYIQNYKNIVSFINSQTYENDDNEDLYILRDTEMSDINGIIIEKSTKKVVCSNYNKIQKIDNFCINKIQENVIMEYLEDGTVIRLYNYKNVWKTATTNCYDASKSFWGDSGKSFNDLFWELFNEKDLNYIDKDNTYVFVLKHNDTRRIIKYLKNELIFLSAINNITGNENHLYFQHNFVNKFKRPQRVNMKWQTQLFMINNELIKVFFHPNSYKDLNTYFIKFFGGNVNIKQIAGDDQPSKTLYLVNNRLIEKLETLNDYYTPFKRGILIKVIDNFSYKSYQYDFEKYKDLDLLRGNTITLNDRFLELYLKNDRKSIKKLERYYKVKSDNVLNNLRKLYKSLLVEYKNTHKLHLYTIDKSNKLFTTLKQIHAIYFSKNKSGVNSEELENILEDLILEDNDKNEDEKIEAEFEDVDLKAVPINTPIEDLNDIEEAVTPNKNPIEEAVPINTPNKKNPITYVDVVNHVGSLHYKIVKNMLLTMFLLFK